MKNRILFINAILNTIEKYNTFQEAKIKKNYNNPSPKLSKWYAVAPLF